jgi:DNA-binding response OmpR family regulator
MFGVSEMSFSSGQGHEGKKPHAVSFGSDDKSERLSDLRILIVEDEIFVSMALEDALTSAGAEVIGPAISLAAGIELVDSEVEIDGAILDVNLGDALVFPLAEMLRARGVPIIFHTALGDRVEFSRDFPEATVCVKPTLPNELIGRAAAMFG